MTSHTGKAHEAVTAARAQLDAAEAPVKAALARVQATRMARAVATAHTTPKVLATLIADAGAAEEHLVLCETARTKAAAVLEAALRGVQHAERADVLAAQHHRGVRPICEIERDVQRLAGEIDVLRAKQATLYVVEVVPRAPPWFRGHAFQEAPTGHFASLQHVLAMHFRPEPVRPAAIAPTTPALVADEVA